MVKLIDVHAMRELLRRDGVQPTLSGLRDYLRADFARWRDFDKSPRMATHWPWGVIELMPVSDERFYAFKYVNGHPGNPADGHQTVVAVGLLAEVASGYPLLISEMTVLTALRTAATSALAAGLCARPDASRLAMIGAGAQAEFQVLAMAEVLPISEVRCFDIRPASMDKLRANLSPYGVEVEPCSSIEGAVAGADVVTTATAVKGHRRVLRPEQVRPGVHVNAIGGDCPGKTELDPAILQGARVIVEYAPQTRVEGEIQQLAADSPVTELWQLVAGLSRGRHNGSQVTVFDSVGFALEDYAALRYVMDRAQALGLGEEAALIPRLPRADDLFGAMVGAPPAGARRRAMQGRHGGG